MINKFKNYLINMFFKSKSTLFDSIDEYITAKEEEKEVRFSFKWWLQVIMKLIFLIIITAVSLLLFGCSATTITEYKQVYVPVSCNVNDVKKPKPSGDIIKDNIMILKYADELLINLNKCKKVK